MNHLDTLDSAIDQWLRTAYPERLRQPTGRIRQPFVDPGTGYEDVLWDWDAYFACLGLSRYAGEDPRIGIHARGCVEGLLERQGPDGSVPYAVMAHHGSDSPAQDRPSDSPRNSAKPLLAQFACLAHTCGGGDVAWLGGLREALGRHVEHWFATQSCRFDLLTWRSHRGSGADNHPAYFQRPHDSVADPYLNSLMVLECRALAAIHRATGSDPTPWERRADDLSAAIERWLWDPIDGTYYAIDVGQGDPGPVRTPADWAVPLKFRSWVMVLPLVAGVAAGDRAERVVHEHLLPTNQLRSRFGLRSLARCEPAYRVFADFNPSDWCGPVWVVSTYLGFRALLRYGYRAEAEALATDHLAALAADHRQHGVLHEYYHPETGCGLTHPGFVNWNSCAALMAPELTTGTDHCRHWTSFE